MLIITVRKFFLILALGSVLGLSLPAHAQCATAPGRGDVPTEDESPVSAIKTDDGFLLVWNRPDLHFTILIKGKDIKPLNDTEHIFFNVDGMVFQVQLAALREFAPDAIEKKLDDKYILAAHREWEAKYIETLLGKPLKVQVFSARLSSGSDASLWQFDMPPGTNADARKQVYLTVVSKPYVLLLNSAVTATVSEDTARKFLLETMATLKVSAAPINVKKLSETIRAGNKL